MNEVLNAYAKADFRFAHALNVFQCIKSLEKMKSTNESVIVITDSFICTSMVDEEGKTDNENIQDHIAKVFVLIISYLTHMAKRTDLN